MLFAFTVPLLLIASVIGCCLFVSLPFVCEEDEGEDQDEERERDTVAYYYYSIITKESTPISHQSWFQQPSYLSWHRWGLLL